MQPIVITGGPGAGKTTLLNALGGLGYATFAEGSRALIEQQSQLDNGVDDLHNGGHRNDRPSRSGLQRAGDRDRSAVGHQLEGRVSGVHLVVGRDGVRQLQQGRSRGLRTSDRVRGHRQVVESRPSRSGVRPVGGRGSRIHRATGRPGVAADVALGVGGRVRNVNQTDGASGVTQLGEVGRGASTSRGRERIRVGRGEV